MTIFALVDCNNFYVSCERAFNPRLEGKPVVVLSNNDGCVISRSKEAKLLGIPMGAPYYQWEGFCRKHQVFAFSSNYELYGDMSHRVMTILRDFCPELEVYSIDEAFLMLDSFVTTDLYQYCLEMRKKIKMYTGIPVSIGFAPTKTLSKVANHIAKKKTISGIYDLCTIENQHIILSEFLVRDVWGIGRRLAAKFNKMQIYTAKDLRDADIQLIRSHSSVVIEKLVRELRGEPCLTLEVLQPRKQIISSRSFGKAVTELADLEEAVSYYAATASLKLRRQQSVASALGVFIQTNSFKEKSPQYANSIMFPFSVPSADTCYIISIAKKCLQQIYKPGYHYNKAGIMLLDLKPNAIEQFDMFSAATNQKSKRVMTLLDAINQSLGKKTVFICAEGIKRPWKIKCNKLSSHYTTSWKELVKVR